MSYYIIKLINVVVNVKGILSAHIEKKMLHLGVFPEKTPRCSIFFSM
jgi:hypothetical protein